MKKMRWIVSIHSPGMRRVSVTTFDTIEEATHRIATHATEHDRVTLRRAEHSPHTRLLPPYEDELPPARLDLSVRNN